MSKKLIEKPKVFISYAWADEDYQNLVLSFAYNLMSDGIDVILDKWDLSEGNDTYAFMEKCVTDSTVTNVLMLLDPVYATKADEHSGGVGTETQIISAEVYKEVTQDKFIPIVMKRDNNGDICKPVYLKSRLHFDLSLPENYDQEYQRLVRKLYGHESYVKPDLGTRPSWVDNATSMITTKTLVYYDSLKSTKPVAVKKDELTSFINAISNELMEFAGNTHKDISSADEYINMYDETESAREKLLQLLQRAIYVEDYHKQFASFFEEITNNLPQNGFFSEIVRIRLHELFLYVIAFLLKKKEYVPAAYLFNRTYYNTNEKWKDYGANSYHMFYSGQIHNNLDSAIRLRDNKEYYSGTGQHWMETIDSECCSKEQFILADLLCYNCSVYGYSYKDNWPWFPITYVYDNRDNSVLGDFGRKLVSREYVQTVLPLFGYKTLEEFQAKMKSIEDKQKSQRSEIRYPGRFDSASLLCDFIKAKDVGRYS